ncbi:MAG: tRNA (adenosine(37)-N6)-threonylcarbamoyltransferase complex dimerization subunit type 1 TsaB [Planctomycetaceae bacterium]|jgi:tRNA threonylcarbamoyladenosine biosynthesis protein TsaB|nr:tRNA (adenosine(37)-N6)-threonylcarbamoyltransferase complex dimerization subunit type 1 TsaB [Planctomycetaceae bacterium]
MKLLAIETVEKQGSVAFSEDRKIALNTQLPKTQRSAQSLVPTIRDGLAQLGWLPKSLTHIAVATGPGSFTGLRVGVTTARMLAYGIGANLIGVNTLQSIAANLSRPENPDTVFSTVIDAQRGDLSAQFFRCHGGGIPAPLSEIELLPVVKWWEKTSEYDKIVVAGPILGKFLSQKPKHVTAAEERMWFPDAEGVSRIAWEKIAHHELDDLWTLLPFYSRRSAAEEKRDRK